MPTDRRLPEGGLIDRTKALSFRFNEQSLLGFSGDSLASALLANGIHMVGRSFKFHRPRGIFSAGEEEPNALLEIGSGASRIPSSRATLVELSQGLEAHSQKGWPSLGFDLGRVFDFSHRLWPAGFYNKTFKWPSWHSWEGMIRGLSGLGRTPEAADPDHYEHNNAHCDLLICGGGPAGLLATLVAGRSGARVILAEQDIALGGSLIWEQVELHDKPASAWIDEVVTELQSLPNVILLTRTTATGVYDHNVTTLLQRSDPANPGPGWRECYWTVTPRRIVLAGGAIEQGLVFPNNDRPGIMLAGAVRQYLNRYAVAAGKRVVMTCNNNSAYQTVADLHDRGIEVMAVADSRTDSQIDAQIRQRMDELGVRLFTEADIANTRGTRRIRQARIQTLAGKNCGRFECDLLAVSGGWAPRVHLLCHARGTLKFDPLGQSFLPDRLPGGFAVLGSAAGIMNLPSSMAHSVDTTIKLCTELGFQAHSAYQPQVSRSVYEAETVKPIQLKPSKRRQWIDLAHDVTFADAELAVSEGYEHVEHFKRYTTTGMSVDQGKTGNINAFLALSALTGRDINEIGTTTFRPPYMPVTLGAIAGRNLGEFYSPRRYLPAHRIHQLLHAEFEDYGGWQRPDCYPQKEETRHLSIEREVLAVRKHVGIFDNSPIGKIEVFGPDAAEFLSRIYINNVHSLAVGRVRYGLMLNENGVIIDDGVFCRLDKDHFLVNTTSGGVNRILALMEELRQCDWPDLQVLVDDVTTQWANFTLAGPLARDLIQRLGCDIDLSPEAFPHMAVSTGHITDQAVRLARVSFSGELSYEINVPADQAHSFLANTLHSGKDFDIMAYGIEALMLLRLEKGYLHVGSDTDGQTTPDDVGWGRAARNKSTDFIGKRSLFRPANEDPQRKQLVGIVPLNDQQPVRPGTHLLVGENRKAPATTDGWITSAAWSPTLKRTIALGMVRGGRSLEGTVLTAIDENTHYPVSITSTPFYDPDNERLNS